MIKASQKTIIITDSSKLGKRGFAKIGNMEEIDTIVTDSHITNEDILQLEDLGIKVIKAPCRPILCNN